MAGFLCGCWVQNSGPHARIASILATEPCLKPQYPSQDSSVPSYIGMPLASWSRLEACTKA